MPLLNHVKILVEAITKNWKWGTTQSITSQYEVSVVKLEDHPHDL